MILGFEPETEPLTDYESTELLPAIIRGLETKVGKENAITNVKMIGGLRAHGYKGLSEVRIRKIINHIRVKGIIRNLIASNRGYWIENDLQERKRYVSSVRQRAEAMMAILNSIDVD